MGGCGGYGTYVDEIGCGQYRTGMWLTGEWMFVVGRDYA